MSRVFSWRLFVPASILIPQHGQTQSVADEAIEDYSVDEARDGACCIPRQKDDDEPTQSGRVNRLCNQKTALC
jgi:hypothetical protein